jgi:hypothetical protein
VVLTEGSALLIQVKSVRLELDVDLRKLERAEDMIVSDSEIMRGSAKIYTLYGCRRSNLLH